MGFLPLTILFPPEKPRALAREEARGGRGEAEEAPRPLRYICTREGLGRRETQTYLTQIRGVEAECVCERMCE